MHYSIRNYAHNPVSYTVPVVVKASWGEVIIGGEYEASIRESAVRKAFQVAREALDIEAGAKALLDCAELLKQSPGARSKHNIDELTGAVSKNVRMLVVFAKAQLSTIAASAEKARKVKVDTLVTLDRYLHALEDLF